MEVEDATVDAVGRRLRWKLENAGLPGAQHLDPVLERRKKPVRFESVLDGSEGLVAIRRALRKGQSRADFGLGLMSARSRGSR